MKFPCIPLYIDEFVQGVPSAPLGETSGRLEARTTSNVYLLSHFHTDHMKGLSFHWRSGFIVCTSVTKALVAQRFGKDVDALTIPLPMWQRTQLFEVFCASNEQGLPGERSSKHSVFVTLLPAYHIPGSVMFYLESPLGRVLYTGDFKFHAAARDFLSPYFDQHCVDHVYLDDTWLHLGKDVSGVDEPGVAVHQATNQRIQKLRCMGGRGIATHLLDEEQLVEAFGAIQKRMEKQRKCFEDGRADPRSQPGCRRIAYKLYVYLHNQFGKEVLVQKLAALLKTKILMDGNRYGRLQAVNEVLDRESVAATLPGCSSTSGYGGMSKSNKRRKRRGRSLDSEDVDALLRRRWITSGGERSAYNVDLRYFTAAAQSSSAMPVDVDEGDSGLCEAGEDDSPLIEVVNTRARITPEALQKAAGALNGTPHYAVIMSGWAGRQRLRHAANGAEKSGDVWHVPTTLHCTPQEIIHFISLLRPMSVTPLHYAASRDAIMMVRLGRFLRRAYHNDYLKPFGLVQESLIGATWRFLLTPSDRESPQGCKRPRLESGKGFRLCRSHPSLSDEEEEQEEDVGSDEDDIAAAFREEEPSDPIQYPAQSSHSQTVWVRVDDTSQGAETIQSSSRSEPSYSPREDSIDSIAERIDSSFRDSQPLFTIDQTTQNVFCSIDG